MCDVMAFFPFFKKDMFRIFSTRRREEKSGERPKKENVREKQEKICRETLCFFFLLHSPITAVSKKQTM
jgi:hypothetical protein